MEAVQDFKVEAVCALPRDHDADGITSDGHAISFWQRSDGAMTFGWDGEAAHRPFDSIAQLRDKSPAIFPSPDGAHIGYVALRSEEVVVGRDGGEDPPMPNFSRSVPLVFSHDGRHLAYGRLDGDDARLVLDGEPRGGNLAPIGAVFSPDGDRLAYVEMRGSSRSEAEVRIVLDGEAGDWMTGMRNAPGVMQFSADSRRFAYCRAQDDGRKVQWVVDGAAQGSYQEVRSVGLAQLRGIGVQEPPLNARFSPDGRRFAYFADVPEKGVAVVEDSVPGPVLKGVGWIVFSPDSRRIAYLGVRPDGQTGLVLDGLLGPTWDATGAGLPVFSPDSRHVAIVLARQTGGLLRRRRRFALIVDGHLIAESDGDDASESPVFSADGEHVAWWVTHGSTAQIWLDDSPIGDRVAAVGEPAFTGSGRLAFAGLLPGGDTGAVFVGGEPGPVADGLAAQRTLLSLFGTARGPQSAFSLGADREQAAWIGRFGAMWRPVLGDAVGPAFEAPLAVGAPEGGVVTWYFQSHGEVVRVTA